MTFFLRAAVAIGVLSYLALVRDGADPAFEARKLAGHLPATVAPAALAAAAPVLRESVVREGLARGLMAELSRRAAAEPTSGDTLEDTDRQPAWRGSPAPR